MLVPAPPVHRGTGESAHHADDRVQKQATASSFRQSLRGGRQSEGSWGSWSGIHVWGGPCVCPGAVGLDWS